MTAQCDARTGYVAGEWQETPVWCATTVGLTSYQDDHGVTRFYCRHHRTFVEHRYPVARPPEACRWCGDTGAIVDGRYVLVNVPDPLNPSGTLRVCCDTCYDRISDDRDEDDEEFDRESQPEFSGQFA